MSRIEVALGSASVVLQHHPRGDRPSHHRRTDPPRYPGQVAALSLGHGAAREAREAGLDPDRWFQNVEVIAAREIGRETVDYVSNIYKYYLAYTLLAEHRAAEQRAESTTRVDRK